MKNKIFSNLGLKLISVVFAFALWMIVVNVDDPVTTKKYKDINVSILNEMLLDEQGQVYQVLDNSSKITITVKAKRSVVESLTKDDFYASADMAERVTPNTIPIKVHATKSQDKIADITLSNNTVKISVEEKRSKEIPVELHLSGSVGEGYAVGKNEVSPQKITISGPASEIANVHKVVVSADVNGIAKEMTSSVNGTLCNANGDAVNVGRIVQSSMVYHVRVALLHTKSVDLDFTTQGVVADGYRYMNMIYSPTTVMLAGSEEALQNISTLHIPAEELDISQATANITQSVDVSKYLPSGLKMANDNDKIVSVTLKIERLNSKNFTIPVSSIDILNTPTGLDTTFDQETEVVVVVNGQNDQLSNLSASQIHLSVDLKGREAGGYQMVPEVSLPGDFSLGSVTSVHLVLVPSRNNTVTSPPVNEGGNPGTGTEPTETPQPTKAAQLQ